MAFLLKRLLGRPVASDQHKVVWNFCRKAYRVDHQYAQRNSIALSVSPLAGRIVSNRSNSSKIDAGPEASVTCALARLSDLGRLSEVIV